MFDRIFKCNVLFDQTLCGTGFCVARPLIQCYSAPFSLLRLSNVFDVNLYPWP